jgi:DNA/RNA-binding protein KIN17
MPKYEPGTAAFASNQMRKSQKTKIRWYCGLCHVPCKDENGFKCHLSSEPHLLREQAVDDSLRTFKVTKTDREFRKKFLDFLIAKHFGQTVFAHEVYRELYPLDRPQNIMKGTCWETLGTFIAQLRKEGRLEAHKGVKGWQIRIATEDFGTIEHESDDDAEKEFPAVAGKRKAEKSESEGFNLLHLKRAKEGGEIQKHSESTGRTSENKLVFSLSTSSQFSMKPALKRGPLPGFGQESFDESDKDS